MQGVGGRGGKAASKAPPPPKRPRGQPRLAERFSCGGARARSGCEATHHLATVVPPVECPPCRLRLGNVDSEGLLTAGHCAEVRHRPIEANQPLWALDEPGRLRERHAKAISSSGSFEWHYCSKSAGGHACPSARHPRSSRLKPDRQ